MTLLIIQNCGVETLGRYYDSLHDWGVGCHVVHPYRGEPYPPVAEIDAIIVGGTPISAYAIEGTFLDDESVYLSEALAAGKPCLGVCFGGQILAQLLGGQVRPNDEKEIGTYEVDLTTLGGDNPILSGFPDSFPVFHWHGDTFELPPGADLLVEGKACRNQMFRKGNVVGVQFHLEVSTREVSAWADEYTEELAAFGKTQGQLVAECRERETELVGGGEDHADQLDRLQ